MRPRLDPEYFASVLRRIDRAEREHTSSPGHLLYLRAYVEKTRHLQAHFEGRPGSFWTRQLLKERRDSIDRLLRDYISGDDLFGPRVPGSGFLFSMETAVAEGRRSGQLNRSEGLYLRNYLTKTRNLRQDFESGGWTTWKKQLYLERVASLRRLLRDYLDDEFLPHGSG